MAALAVAAAAELAQPTRCNVARRISRTKAFVLFRGDHFRKGVIRLHGALNQSIKTVALIISQGC